MTTTAQAIPTTLPFKQFTQPTTTGIIHYISQQSYDEEDGDKLSEREGQRLTFQALFGKARNPLRHARRNQQSCLVVYSISLVTTGYIVSLAVGWPFLGRTCFFPAASIPLGSTRRSNWHCFSLRRPRF